MWYVGATGATSGAGAPRERLWRPDTKGVVLTTDSLGIKTESAVTPVDFREWRSSGGASRGVVQFFPKRVVTLKNFAAKTRRNPLIFKSEDWDRIIFPCPRSQSSLVL